MTIPIPRAKEATPATVENVLIRGDLSGLSETQRLEYYNQVCKSIGLNPLTRPFEYITLGGKLVLYARRDAADQLRKLNGISIEIVSQDFARGLLTIHVRAKDKDGRTDEDLGVVPFPETAKGDLAANIILKAVTKAKRRVTLSLSGLGYLDETEVQDIPGAAIELTDKFISEDQVKTLNDLIAKAGKSQSAFIQWVRQTCPDVTSMETIPETYFPDCEEKLKSMVKK